MQVLQGAAHPFLAATGASAAGPLSASFWLASLGALGVFVVVFAETGLLAGCVAGLSRRWPGRRRLAWRVGVPAWLRAGPSSSRT